MDANLNRVCGKIPPVAFLRSFSTNGTLGRVSLKTQKRQKMSKMAVLAS